MHRRLGLDHPCLCWLQYIGACPGRPYLGLVVQPNARTACSASPCHLFCVGCSGYSLLPSKLKTGLRPAQPECSHACSSRPPCIYFVLAAADTFAAFEISWVPRATGVHHRLLFTSTMPSILCWLQRIPLLLPSAKGWVPETGVLAPLVLHVHHAIYFVLAVPFATFKIKDWVETHAAGMLAPLALRSPCHLFCVGCG